MRNSPDARCAHCQNLFKDQCQAAQERLLAAGFPLLAIRPNQETVADSCPDYLPDPDEFQSIEDAHAQLTSDAAQSAAKQFSLPLTLFRT